LPHYSGQFSKLLLPYSIFDRTKDGMTSKNISTLEVHRTSNAVLDRSARDEMSSMPEP